MAEVKRLGSEGVGGNVSTAVPAEGSATIATDNVIFENEQKFPWGRLVLGLVLAFFVLIIFGPLMSFIMHVSWLVKFVIGILSFVYMRKITSPKVNDRNKFHVSKSLWWRIPLFTFLLICFWFSLPLNIVLNAKLWIWIVLLGAVLMPILWYFQHQLAPHPIVKLFFYVVLFGWIGLITGIIPLNTVTRSINVPSVSAWQPITSVNSGVFVNKIYVEDGQVTPEEFRMGGSLQFHANKWFAVFPGLAKLQNGDVYDAVFYQFHELREGEEIVMLDGLEVKLQNGQLMIKNGGLYAMPVNFVSDNGVKIYASKSEQELKELKAAGWIIFD